MTNMMFSLSKENTSSIKDIGVRLMMAGKYRRIFLPDANNNNKGFFFFKKFFSIYTDDFSNLE